MKKKSTMVAARTALAVDEARVGVAALGTNGDCLAQEINIAVARAGEGTIGQGDDIPIHRGGHRRLDGRIIAAAVGSDGPGAGKRIGNDESQYTQTADDQVTDGSLEIFLDRSKPGTVLDDGNLLGPEWISAIKIAYLISATRWVTE